MIDEHLSGPAMIVESAPWERAGGDGPRGNLLAAGSQLAVFIMSKVPTVQPAVLGGAGG